MVTFMQSARKHVLLGAFALLAFAVCSPLSAQSGNGIVKGTVTDSSSAVIANASVTLTNQDTNVSRKGSSSADGLFTFPDIPPGRYIATVQNSGFQKWVGRFEVPVGQAVTLDISLTVGDVASTIEVTAAAPIVTTEGAQIADVKDALRIRQLPLNGRAISNLFNLTPGVEGGDAGTAPRVNGLKVGSAEILQDGVSLVNRFGGGINRVQPGLDTVQEFRIETNGSNARYSRPATITLITKSGTNSFHGSLFETHRNNAAGLRARRREDGSDPAKLIRNEFGGSAGGPVYIPKLYDGRNKTFWFSSWEALRQREKVFYSDIVPTEAMWNGNFNGLVDNNGVRTNIYDPLTTDASGIRQPLPGNIIPQNRVSPIFKALSALVHRPTNSILPTQGNNLETYYPLTTDNNNFTTRIDHRFSDSDNISGRMTRSALDVLQTGGKYGAPIDGLSNGFGTGGTQSKVYSASITHVHTFTPTLLSELLLTANRNPNHQGTLADQTGWATQLGLPNPFGSTGWPTICAGDFCFDSDNRRDQNLTAFGLEQNTTWTRGKHSFSFGGKLRHELNNVQELQQAQGSHTFGPDWTALYDGASDSLTSYTGNGIASLALGLPTFLSNQYNRGYFYFRQWEMGLYAHDTWKVTPKLTLDLGLRWDNWTPYQEKFNRLVNVDLNNFAGRMQVVTPGDHTLDSLPGIPASVLTSWAQRGLTWTTADKAGLPSALLPTDQNNFGPRIGAAYRIGTKMSVRGGYGEYFWTMPLSQILQTSRINPPLNLRYTNQIGNLDGTNTTALRLPPQANQFVGQAQVDINGLIILPATARSFMPWDYRNWQDGHSRQWNFTIEREILPNTSLRLSYVGTHATGLEQRFSINGKEAEINYQARTGVVRPSRTDLLRINPDWNFNAIGKFGYSNTHAAQVEVQRRFSSGLAFQWFYAFTRSLNTTDAGDSSAGDGSLNDTGGNAIVPENSQLLGNPNLSFDKRIRLSYTNSSNIPAHRMRWNGVYDLPFGRGKSFGKSSSGLVNAIIGGWQIATIGDWRSGNWLSISPSEYMFGNPALSADQRLDLTYNGRPQRLYFRGDFDPTRATNVDAQKLQALVPVDRNARIIRPIGSAFDNRVVQKLADGTTRLTSITDTLNWNARSFFLGPRAWNVDASIFKWFNFTETTRMRLTADFFNALNHPNDVSPNSSTGLQDLSVQANNPRIIQLSARFEW